MIDNTAARARLPLAVLAALIAASSIAAPSAASRGKNDAGRPDKVSGAVRKQMASGSDVLDVIVRFRQVPGRAEKELVVRAGGRLRHAMERQPLLAARMSRKGVRALEGSGAVEYIATDAPVDASMDVARLSVGIPDQQEPEAAPSWFDDPFGGQSSSTPASPPFPTGAGVTVAVLDSGIASHAELSPSMTALDFVPAGDPQAGGGFVWQAEPTPVFTGDPHGHGTHVAGIIAANGSQSGGRFRGVAPGAGLVALRVLDEQGRGRTSDVIAALDWVLAHHAEYGIRVLNLSLGHPVYEPASLDPLVAAAEQVWDAGVVVVCSAGNLGRYGSGSITSPCNARKLISVGATNDRNTADWSDDLLTTYTSVGPTLFDRFSKPDLVAPGNRIVSTRSVGSTLDTTYPERRVVADPARPEVVEFFELSGTSMAAPFVTGAAALMLESEPWLNPGTVKARLMRSARKPDVGNPFSFGAGVLDIQAALQETGWVWDAPSPIVTASGELGALSFENTGQLWGNPEFSLVTLWSAAVVWASSGYEDILWSYSVVWPDSLLWPSGALFGDAAIWPDSSMWPDTTLWDESVIWPDAEAAFIGDPLEGTSQSQFVDDPS